MATVKFCRITLLVLIQLLAISCSEDLEPIVVVHIPQVPDDVVTISVRPQLGGSAGQLLQIMPETRTDLRFGIAVPRGSTAELLVELTGISDDDCVAATGSASLAVAGAAFPADLAAPLLALPARRCTLTVAVSGDGARVVSEPAGIDCVPAGGTCALQYAPSETAALRLLPQTDAHTFHVWSGDCAGAGACELTLNRQHSLRAAFDPRACVAGNICYYSPAPGEVSFNAIAAVGSDEAWAVGSSGADWAGHYVDGRWTLVPTGVTTPLRAVWMGSASSVWAVGDFGTAVRWDGTKFQTVPTDATTQLTSVWGAGDTEVWAVGDDATTLRYDGRKLAKVTNTVASVELLNSVWGTGASDVWVAGSAGTVMRWNGQAFIPQVAPDPQAAYSRVFGSGPTNVWLIADKQAWMWNGAAWKQVRREPEQLTSGFSRSAADTWLLRGAVRTSAFDGRKWTLDQFPSSASSMRALAPSGAKDVWAAGADGEINRASTGSWTQEAGFAVTRARNRINVIWGASSDDIWAAASFATLHWDGRTWEENGPYSSVNYALFGTARDDVWLLGNQGEVTHYDGTRWNKLASVPGAVFYGGWAASRTLAYAVGAGGGIYRWDGATWQKVNSPTTANLLGVWGSSATDLWAVGNGGAIVRSDGTTWTLVTPRPTTANFRSVAGSGPNDVLLVGDDLWHWDGAAYSRNASPLPSPFLILNVQMTPSGKAWASGNSGAILRWNGSSWSAASPAVPGDLTALFVAGEKDVWFGGNRQQILRYMP